MASLQVIWRAGRDEWRNLTAELAGQDFTAISRSGAARIIEPAAGDKQALHLRLPFEGGFQMLEDGRYTDDDGLTGWRELADMRITPCGITLAEPGAWITADGVRGPGYSAQGTPLLAVVSYFVPILSTTAEGRSIIDDIVTGAPAGARAGHPDTWCGARYCPRHPVVEGRPPSDHRRSSDGPV